MLTDKDKLIKLKAMSGESDDDMLSAYLDLAGEHVLRRAYPFARGKVYVPDKYAHIQIEIACYLLNKRGAEGETAHSENGISRTYEAASVPDSLLKQITPYAEVL